MANRGFGRGERGAALIEMAIVTPLLLLLLLGIIEFGYLFGEYNEVRHAAREGARFAAVSRPDLDGDSTPGDNDDVLLAVCDALNLPGGSALVSLSADDTNGSGSTDRLDNATVTVVASVDSLSSAPLISDFLPSDLTNHATFRLEQDPNWTAFTDQPCP